MTKVNGLGSLRDDARTSNDNRKYRGLSTAAAKCAASGRDDVVCGEGERTDHGNGNSSDSESDSDSGGEVATETTAAAARQ